MNKLLNVMTLGLCILSGKVYAETIRGQINLAPLKNAIKYEYEKNSGQYALNIEDSIDYKMILSKEEVSKMDCEKEQGVAKIANGELSVDYFIRKGEINPIAFDLNIYGQLVHLEKIQEKIDQDLKLKGIEVKPLELATYAITTDFNINFEWMEDAPTFMAKGNLVQHIEQDIGKQLRTYESRSDISERGRVRLNTKAHVFVCDLLDKKVNLYVNSKVTFKTKIKTDGPVTKKQIQALNASVYGKKHLIKSEGENNLSLNEKLVNASALLAYESNKLGFDESILKNSVFSTMLGRFFAGQKYEPKILNSSQVDDLYQDLMDTDHRESFNKELTQQKIKIEVM